MAQQINLILQLFLVKAPKIRTGASTHSFILIHSLGGPWSDGTDLHLNRGAMKQQKVY
jgi:hypothetical protein